MHQRDYQIGDKTNSKRLTEFSCREGQLLLPLVELITHTEMPLDELIDATGRAAIEAVLTLSAQELADPKHPGKKAGDVRWYGRQSTTVLLSNRKLRVDKPRLRRKGVRTGQGRIGVAAIVEAIRQSMSADRNLHDKGRGRQGKNLALIQKKGAGRWFAICGTRRAWREMLRADMMQSDGGRKSAAADIPVVRPRDAPAGRRAAGRTGRCARLVPVDVGCTGRGVAVRCHSLSVGPCRAGAALYVVVSGQRAPAGARLVAEDGPAGA